MIAAVMVLPWMMLSRIDKKKCGRSKKMNADNEEIEMKCGRCCQDCPIENDKEISRKISEA